MRVKRKRQILKQDKKVEGAILAVQFAVASRRANKVGRNERLMQHRNCSGLTEAHPQWTRDVLTLTYVNSCRQSRVLREDQAKVQLRDDEEEGKDEVEESARCFRFNSGLARQPTPHHTAVLYSVSVLPLPQVQF